MQLLIPKNEAINILKQRLTELNTYGFNPKVWKDRTILDLKQIFGPLGDQWLQVSSIYFDTAVTSQKAQKLQEGKQAAAGLLNSYIDFIEQYSKISAQRAIIKEQGFEDKYYQLLADYNKNGKEYIALMDDHSALLNENADLTNKLSEAEQENEHLIENTLQLDNITVRKLWRAISNLPTIQIVTIISILAGLLITAFTIGQLIEKNSANNESFELKTENKELKTSFQKMSNEIDGLKNTIKIQADSIDRLNDTTSKKK